MEFGWLCRTDIVVMGTRVREVRISANPDGYLDFDADVQHDGTVGNSEYVVNRTGQRPKIEFPSYPKRDLGPEDVYWCGKCQCNIPEDQWLVGSWERDQPRERRPHQYIETDHFHKVVDDYREKYPEGEVDFPTDLPRSYQKWIQWYFCCKCLTWTPQTR